MEEKKESKNSTLENILFTLLFVCAFIGFIWGIHFLWSNAVVPVAEKWQTVSDLQDQVKLLNARQTSFQEQSIRTQCDILEMKKLTQGEGYKYFCDHAHE